MSDLVPRKRRTRKYLLLVEDGKTRRVRPRRTLTNELMGRLYGRGWRFKEGLLSAYGRKNFTN